MFQDTIDLSEFEDNEQLRQELTCVKHFLRDYVLHQKHQTIFNFRMSDNTHESLNRHLDTVYNSLDCAAKLNISFGFILKNIDDDIGFRYFHAHTNNTVFDKPVMVATPGDMDFMKDRLDGEDFFEHMTRERPDTKWRFYKVTNVSVIATMMHDVHLGCKNTNLPEFLTRNNRITTLLRNPETREPYNDNLCMIRGVAMHKLGPDSDGRVTKSTALNSRTKDLFKEYMASFPDKDPSRFRGVRHADIPVLERIASVDIYVYGVDYVNGQIVGELVRRSAGAYGDTVHFIQYNNHVCYVRDIKTVFHKYRCQHCDHVFAHSCNLAKHLKKCNDRIRHKYPGGIYRVKETIFEKLHDIGVIVPANLQLFRNLAIFDFESMCVPCSDDVKCTENLNWIGKHIPVSVSISSNLVQGTIFHCNENPLQLIEEFVKSLEDIAAKSNLEMMGKMAPYLETLDSMIAGLDSELRQRSEPQVTEEDKARRDAVIDAFVQDLIEEEEREAREQQTTVNPFNGDDSLTDQEFENFLNDLWQGDEEELGEEFFDNLEEERDECIEALMESDNDMDQNLVTPIKQNFNNDPIYFLKQQRQQWNQIRSEFIRYISTLPVFGYNSSRYDLNLIKEYLVPYLVNEKQIPPEVIKRTNQYVSFKFGDIQFLDIMNFLAGASTLDSFLKAYKTEETKGFFPYEWLDSFNKLELTHLPPYESFYSKLRKCNPLEKDFLEYNKLVLQGKTSEDALKSLKLRSVPPTGKENYDYLVKVWQDNGMETFRDFLRWYNDKDVIPTLEAMQKMMEFYHNKGVDMLKLGCTLPNLANRILHQSTKCMFWPFSEKDKDLAEKLREDTVGGPPIVFTRKAEVGVTRIRDSDNVCQSILGIDANQLYPYAMCQPMPTGPYTRWEIKEENGLFYPKYNGKSRLEMMVLGFEQIKCRQCTIETLYTAGKQKKIGPYFVDGYCAHCRTVFEVMGCYYHACSCQDAKLSTTEQKEKAEKKRQRDQERREYIRGKGYRLVERWECEWWKAVKEDKNGEKLFMKHNFPFNPPMSEEKLISKIRCGEVFGYVQCDIHVPDDLKPQFAYYPPIFKNANVSRADISDLMRQHAEQHNLLRKPQRMLVSSYYLENGTLITPQVKFLLDLGLKLTKIYRLVEYTPKYCFVDFVDSVVEARRAGDQNPASSVVAETMKLIGNSSYGYQIMDRRKHTCTKYVNDSKVDSVINNKLFNTYNQITDGVYEIGMAKKVIEHKEPIVVGFFILQYAKLRMIEFYYNFFAKFCDPNLFEEIEMDTDSLYLALGKKSIYECIRPEMRQIWNLYREDDCFDYFRADPHSNFFPRECCSEHKKHDRRTPGLFKEEFRCTKMIALCPKTYCCYDAPSGKCKFSSKGLNKRELEADDDGPLSKYQRVLDDAVNVMSTNRGFRTINNSVRTYELQKKGLAYFYAKRKVAADGIHTTPLDI